jgi:ABC-type histidine transport system ATPase subunit
MSTELSIQNDLGMSLAEAIGVSSSGQTKSAALPRINLIHNAIMGTMEVNGKNMKTEVVPAGAYKVTLGEDNEVYAINPSVRIFAVRQQWSKWDSEDNN